MAAPPTWRDPWAWVSAAAILPLWLGTIGAPRGEPAAEDFDLLRRALLEGGGSLFDGGGTLAFWRPISNQVYFRLLGETILAHPGRVALLHALLLAAAAVLLYRVMRRTWSGPVAAVAASFPLLAESTRALICWPSHFVDVGAFFFLALAIHERASRRLPTGLAALLSALLCKEPALIGALMIPFLPDRAPGAARERVRWLVGAGAVLVGWALAYQWVRAHAGLELPHGLERNPALLRTPLATRLGWALGNSLRASFSLGFERAHTFTALATILVAALAGIAILRSATARARFATVRSWAAWGAAWALASWLALASIFPIWSPYRAMLGSAGLGVAATAVAGAIHPGAALALGAVRLALFGLGPHTPAAISPEPPDRDAFIDYPRLVRLQNLMVVTRRALRERLPAVPHGSTIGFYSLPLSTEYAFGGGHAVQMWYRDSTLRWISLEQFRRDSLQPVAAILQYQPRHRPQMVVLETGAVRAMFEGVAELRAGRWSEALATLARADSLQRDRRARIFLGDVSGRRSYGLAQLSRWNEAEPLAREALAIAPEDVGARIVLALIEQVRYHRRDVALAQLDTLLVMAPDYTEAIELKRALLSLPQKSGH
jgi:tetratricopeptide (TPR) repeat protein